jgi:hypothetical protein
MSAIAVYIFAPPLGLGMAGLGVLFELAGWISLFKDRSRGEEKETWEPLINPSFRRMPESIALYSLGPGLRRDDEQRIIETCTNG